VVTRGSFAGLSEPSTVVSGERNVDLEVLTRSGTSRPQRAAGTFRFMPNSVEIHGSGRPQGGSRGIAEESADRQTGNSIRVIT